MIETFLHPRDTSIKLGRLPIIVAATWTLGNTPECQRQKPRICCGGELAGRDAC
jgi:hypothetical protein